MDTIAFVRASLGNPSNEQIEQGAKQCATMLKDKFGAAALQSKLREIFGEDVVPVQKPQNNLTAVVAALRAAVDTLANVAK